MKREYKKIFIIGLFFYYMLSITTILVLVTFIVIAFFVIHLEHMGKRIKVLIIIALLLGLYFSVSNMVKSGSVDFSSPKGIVNSIYTYFGYLAGIGKSVWDVGSNAVTGVGNAIKIDRNETER